jgi:hypothetical protein
VNMPFKESTNYLHKRICVGGGFGGD